MYELMEFLKREYGSGDFYLGDLLRVVPFKKSKLYSLLNALVEEGLVVKIANGTYKLKEGESYPLPREIIGLSESLKLSITRKFKFTALSVLLPFVHHTPYTVVFSLYVENGSGEDFKEAICDITERFMVLLEPEKEELLMLINETKKNKIIMIRETEYFYGKEHGLAYPDTAFVDLYFEVTRKRIPFMETDVREILIDLVRHNLITYSRLFRYAHDRKLTYEIKDLFLDIESVVKIPEGGLDVLHKIS